MKIRCPRESLLAACQLVIAAVPSKDIKPILRNFKASAVDGKLTLSATDMEIGIQLSLSGVEIDEPGEAIIPAAKLTNILKESRDETLCIDASPSGVVVEGGFIQFEMSSENPDNFPGWPAFDDAGYHEIPAGLLRTLIKRTVIAVATANERYTMAGVLWQPEDAAIRLVGTDGKRMAVMDCAAVSHGQVAGKASIIVPTKAMNLLERNLQDDESELVKVCFRSNDALFRTGRAVLYTRLVEGRFPDYKLVLPKKHSATAVLEVTPLLHAVKQAAVMVEDESRKVAFTFLNDRLTLKAEGAMAGRSKVELPIKYDGKSVTINFNPQYVTDMLRVLAPDAELVLELSDGASPALFRSGSDYQYLVMPLS